MFQSVIDQQEWRNRRLGVGASVSLLVHAGVIAAVMGISARVVAEVEKDPVVVFKTPAPRGTPIPPAVKPVAEPPKPIEHKKKRNPMTMPTVIPPTPKDVVDPPQTQQVEDPPEDLPYDPNARPDGVSNVVPCLQCIVDSGPSAAPEPTGEETVPFSMGTMTAPKLLSGAALQYTREALEAHVQGLLIVKCVITREGEVESCRVIKGQPHMEQAVISALETRRYAPVTYQGRPISVSYIFNIKLDLPR